MQLFEAVAQVMIRQATSDTILVAPRHLGEEGNDELIVRKGQVVMVDIIELRTWFLQIFTCHIHGYMLTTFF